jgi:hypothetical protein
MTLCERRACLVASVFAIVGSCAKFPENSSKGLKMLVRLPAWLILLTYYTFCPLHMTGIRAITHHALLLSGTIPSRDYAPEEV